MSFEYVVNSQRRWVPACAGTTVHAVLLLLLLLLPFTTQAAAPDIAEGRQFLKTWLTALEQRDGARLASLIDDKATFKVLWLDSSPPKTFTLNKTDYLQQLRAGWRFYTEEKIETGDVTWQADPATGLLKARFRIRQTRLFFGKPTGESHEMEMHLGNTGNALRLTGLRTQARMW